MDAFGMIRYFEDKVKLEGKRDGKFKQTAPLQVN